MVRSETDGQTRGVRGNGESEALRGGGGREMVSDAPALNVINVGAEHEVEVHDHLHDELILRDDLADARGCAYTNVANRALASCGEWGEQCVTGGRARDRGSSIRR